MESEISNRRSERKRKRKESYSPEGKKEDCKRNRPDGQRSQNKSKMYSSRLYDILPNGEPFSCHLCKSPYVVNPISKGVKKTGRSRHTPLPKVRTDKNTGREMLLCNACVQIFDRPQRRSVRTATVPTDEEKQQYQKEADNFIKSLKTQFDDPLVERLCCPLGQRKLCGCLQRYIELNGCSEVPVFISLMKEAIELRKEKSYPVTEENKKVKFVGLGNGHKKSKRYEEFVLTQRRILKEDMRLCERATQKILMYSNNFLHKRLKTENRPCRVERTRGKAALGQLPEFHSMVDLHCCQDNCVMMALTHKRLLQSWRDRAQQGQQEARRVMAEMLTPAGATHHNCYSFISMVTGCSQSTIANVYSQMLDTGGVRDPPEHGMKRVWQDHYKQTRVSEGNKDCRSSVSSVESTSQEVTSSHRLTNQSTVIDFENLNAGRQQKLSWIQDVRKNQQQQQQLALQLQELVSAKQKPAQLDQYPGSAQQLISQMQIQPTEVIKNPLLKSNGASVNQFLYFPSTTLTCSNSTPSSNSGHINVGQGHYNTSQGHIQQIVLHPPPQYGINQSSTERCWNQSHLPFPFNVNQTNFLLSGDQQLLPVTHVLKNGPEQPLVSRNEPAIDIPLAKTLPEQFESSETSVQITENTNTGFLITQTPSKICNDSNVATGGHTVSMHKRSQSPAVRQYQVSQAVPMFHFQSQGSDQPTSEHISSAVQTPEHNVRFTPVSDSQHITENLTSNIYFQIIPEIPVTTNSSLIEKPVSSKDPTVSEDRRNYSHQLLPRSEQTRQSSDSYQPNLSKIQSKQGIDTGEKDIERVKEKQLDGMHRISVAATERLHKHSSKNIVQTGETIENHTTMILNNVPNQADQSLQQVNQTQLYLPVSLLQSSHTNQMQPMQIPSQIQISFQTCSSENNQQKTTQQIVLPHGDIITLPLMPISANKDVTVTGEHCVTNIRENSSLPLKTDLSNLVIENSGANMLQGHLQLQPVGQKCIETSETSKQQKSAVKVRNTSGNCKKSRNSSGSSEKTRRSVVQFSSTVRSESGQGISDKNISLEHVSESNFTKLTKNRQRQASGNSEQGDRSRKSSGNSLISETSSHASGLTLSNLASPNIFHDKDKGIFFIQSLDGLELNEIDSTHISDFIQAVEADQSGTVEEQNTPQKQSENHGSGSEVVMLNQSGSVEDESNKTHSRVEVKINGNNSQTEQLASFSYVDSGDGFPFKQVNTSDKREKTHVSSKLLEQNTGKQNESYHKRHRSSNTVKKRSAKNNQSGVDAGVEKVHIEESQSAFVACKHSNKRISGNVSAASFVPIAPKGSEQLWNVGTSRNDNKVSRNTPVLCSLLSRQPVSLTKTNLLHL